MAIKDQQVFIAALRAAVAHLAPQYAFKHVDDDPFWGDVPVSLVYYELDETANGSVKFVGGSGKNRTSTTNVEKAAEKLIELIRQGEKRAEEYKARQELDESLRKLNAKTKDGFFRSEDSAKGGAYIRFSITMNTLEEANALAEFLEKHPLFGPEEEYEG